jgi:hypothetical protein
MANTIQFKCEARGIDVVVTPVLGSPKAGGGHDDRGGGRIPAARAGYACNGSCQVVMTGETAENKQHTLAELLSLVSPVGDGDIQVIGSGLWANIKSWNALVDVNITGDSVQVADISWKGSANPSAA